MCATQAVSFGVGLLAFIGYGASILFLVISALALISAFWVTQGEKGRRDDINVFVAAATIAFVSAAITAVVIKLIG